MTSPSAQSTPQHRKFLIVLRVLLVMIVTLMALGAAVRAMNAGLSCPDWPLCFGKVIPDFHPGTWFEFVHRAYAGLVTFTFLGCAIHAYRTPSLPKAVRRAALFGLFALLAQIIMGGLTVLLLVKSIIVTSHLMLATLFFICVLMMSFATAPAIEGLRARAPFSFQLIAGLFSAGIFGQILLGGFVASTYAGSVCVDWPLCNGQWVPTWGGAIGLQITHRFVAYVLATALLLYAAGVQWLVSSGRAAWVTGQVLRLSRWSAALVCLQVCVGVANLLMYIPPSVTVLHQTVAIVLLAVSLRTYYVARAIVRLAPAATSRPAYPAEHQGLRV